MKFINIIGTTGSGKSTLARKLAEKLKIQYIELDDLLWLDDWQESSNDAFFCKLKLSMDAASTGWVIDNLYSRSIDMIWSEVDTVIWLDYSFHLSFYRCLIRTIKRLITKESLWGSNKETLSNILGKNSILYFMVTHYYKNKKKFESDMVIHSNIKFIRLRTPKEAEAFFTTFR